MAYTQTAGTQVAIGSTYGPVVNMTAITNAVEAVATLAVGHAVVVGDFLELTSGFALLDAQIVRVKTVVTNDVTFELINTLSTARFPAGTGAGSIRRITAFTALTQVGTFAGSGGELQFTDITTISDLQQKQLPTTRTPVVINLGLYDDILLAGQIAAKAASDSGANTAMRLIFANGSRLVANGVVALAFVPEIELASTLKRPLTYSLVSVPNQYPT